MISIIMQCTIMLFAFNYVYIDILPLIVGPSLQSFILTKPYMLSNMKLREYLWWMIASLIK
jgi:hypothetical protein